MDTLYELPSPEDIDYMYDTEHPLQAKAEGGAESSVMVDDKTLLSSLKRIYKGKIDVKEDIEEKMWNEVYRILSEATDLGVAGQDRKVSREFRQKVDYNNAVFSAFKVHRMQNDIAARLRDKDGNLKSFEGWMNDVQPMLDHHVGSWLRTEYDTAVIRMNQAADWQRFEENADIMPNLEWMPSTSAHPGADHKVFWHTIRPVNDPFWNRHRPGDRWNCKCWLRNTDEEATAAPDDGNDPDNRQSPGLGNNPGKDGKLFGDTHPYVKNAYPGAKEAVEKFMDKKNSGWDMKPKEADAINRSAKDIKKEARRLIQGTIINHPDFNKDIKISRKSIDEWTNQPHIYYKEKNELLLKIKDVIKECQYLGYGKDKLPKAGNKWIHLFELEILGDKSWIIVKEYTDGNTCLYSISDNENILNVLKEK